MSVDIEVEMDIHRKTQKNMVVVHTKRSRNTDQVKRFFSIKSGKSQSYATIKL